MTIIGLISSPNNRDVTFLVLGLDNAGKSTVCACLQNGELLTPPHPTPPWCKRLGPSDASMPVCICCSCPPSASTEDVTPTIGFANGRARLKGCDLTLLDLGGGERLREIWHNYYAEVRGTPANAHGSLLYHFGFGEGV